MGLVHVLRLQWCYGGTACLPGLFFLCSHCTTECVNKTSMTAFHFFLWGHNESVFNFILCFPRAKSYNHCRWLGGLMYHGNFPFSLTIKTTWYNSTVFFLITNFAILKHPRSLEITYKGMKCTAIEGYLLLPLFYFKSSIKSELWVFVRIQSYSSISCPWILLPT